MTPETLTPRGNKSSNDIDELLRLHAKVAHEMRTPLNSILGYSQIATESLKHHSYSDLEDCIKNISRSSQHLLYVVNDLLDYTKLKEKKINLETVPINLNKYLTQIKEQLLPLLKKQNNELIIIQENNLMIVNDEFRLNQILYNLIVNANNYTENGEITIKINVIDCDEGNRLYFTISDTGRGISENNLPYIFRPYSQIQRQETVATKGSGLGLTISKELTVKMGGDLHLESIEGIGTTVYLEIPMVL